MPMAAITAKAQQVGAQVLFNGYHSVGIISVDVTAANVDFYVGGTLKWMGVVAPWIMDDGYADAMTTIEGLPDDELAQFLALAEDPGAFDLAQRATLTFGDETDHPFTPAQLRSGS